MKRYGYITPDDELVAEANGISKNTLWKRVNESGWDIDRAITEKTQAHNWLSSELKDTLKANGISLSTYRSRVRRGMDKREASTQPIKPRSEIYKMSADVRRVHKVEDVEEAEKNGINYFTYVARVSSGVSIEDAKTLPVLSNEQVLEHAREASPWAEINTAHFNENAERNKKYRQED